MFCIANRRFGVMTLQKQEWQLIFSQISNN